MLLEKKVLASRVNTSVLILSYGPERYGISVWDRGDFRTGMGYPTGYPSGKSRTRPI